MKTKTFTLATAAVAITFLVAGCSQNELAEQSTNKGEGIKITAQASTTTQPDTRMGYEEIADKLILKWKNKSETDKETFSVLTENGGATQTPIDFTLESGDGSKYGTFTGTIPTETPSGEQLYAIYPKTTATNPTSIALDLSSQSLITTTAELDNNTHHYMLAQAAYAGSSEVTFKFKHQVAILKVTLDFPAGTGDIKEVKLAGVHSTATLDATTQTLTLGSTTEITATHATGVAPDAEKKITVYFYLFPENMPTDAKLTITATNVAKTIYLRGEFSGRNVEAGNVYTLGKIMLEKEGVTVPPTMPEISW